MKIQLDIPEETNTSLKIIKAKKNLKSIADLVIRILKDSTGMINETDEMINETWDKVKSRVKKK